MKKSLILAVLVVTIVATSPFIIRAAAFFFVGDNGYLSIGNSDPQAPLDVSGAIYSRLVTATSTTIDWNKGNVQTMTLGSSPTLTFINAQAGGEYKLILNQDATGGRTVTWPGSVVWTGGSEPALTSSASSTDVITFVNDGGRYLASYYKDFRLPSSLLGSLVSYWKFDASSGNAIDSIGSNTLTNNNSTAYATGKINNGADFERDNTNSFSISDGSQTGLNFTSSFSSSFWFKAESFATTFFNAVVWREKSVNPYDGYGIGLYDAGSNNIHLVGQIQTGSGGDGWDVGSLGITTGTWYHAVFTWDSTTKEGKLYLNGTNVYTHTGTYSLPDSGDVFVIGSTADYNQTYSFDGLIDEVGMWSRVLTPTEVTALYNSGSGRQYPF